MADNPIDRAIVSVRKLNHGRHHLEIKVRILAGIEAPRWAKGIGGPPIPVRDPVTGKQGTVGRFWTDAFGSAYQDLQDKLAAKYDSVPEVYEVTIARCMTIYDEPLIRQRNNRATVSALLQAGYSVAADESCQRQEIAAHRVWKRTLSGLAFNPYEVIRSDGSTTVDEVFTQELMVYCRSTLGRRCVLENNSLHLPVATQGEYGALHAEMRSLGPPISLQTAGRMTEPALAALITGAMPLTHADAIEAPQRFEGYDPKQLATLNQELQGQALHS